jgi:hypothetical protein
MGLLYLNNSKHRTFMFVKMDMLAILKLIYFRKMLVFLRGGIMLHKPLILYLHAFLVFCVTLGYVDVTLLSKKPSFSLSYSLKRRVLLHVVTALLENARQPENSSRPELGSKGERIRGAGALYSKMRHDLSINPH